MKLLAILIALPFFPPGLQHAACPDHIIVGRPGHLCRHDRWEPPYRGPQR